MSRSGVAVDIYVCFHMCVQYLRGSGSLYPVRLKVLGLFVVCPCVCVHYTLSLAVRALPPSHCCVEHSLHYSVCLRSTARTIQCVLGAQLALFSVS